MITIYTNSNVLIPKQHQAATRGPFIFIRSEFKGDRGLTAGKWITLALPD